jgi:hypothetical protein
MHLQQVWVAPDKGTTHPLFLKRSSGHRLSIEGELDELGTSRRQRSAKRSLLVLVPRWRFSA